MKKYGATRTGPAAPSYGQARPFGWVAREAALDALEEILTTNKGEE
jgi:hypothetical protein